MLLMVRHFLSATNISNTRSQKIDKILPVEFRRMKFRKSTHTYLALNYHTVINKYVSYNSILEDIVSYKLKYLIR